MVKTVTGTDKATEEDVKRNYEKLQIYVAKAVDILYDRHCVGEKTVLTYLDEILALKKRYIYPIISGNNTGFRRYGQCIKLVFPCQEACQKLYSLAL